jgi:kinesin family protein 1
MTGYGANKGIIPQACVEIFDRISKNTDPDVGYEVETQVCEIYNEVVQDLCIDPKKRK